MEKFEKVKYTEAAKEQLEKFKIDQAKMLEHEIVRGKYYPGADFIEITASDIQDFAKRVYVRNRRKLDVRYLLVYTYFIAGVMIGLFGIYYQNIVYIWHNQPKQALYILMGATMIFMSLILLFFLRSREKRQIDILNRRRIEELEKSLMVDDFGIKSYYDEIAKRNTLLDLDKSQIETLKSLMESNIIEQSKKKPT